MTDPTPRITDDEVAALPVHSGRADLLEDIMATDLDHAAKAATRAHRRAPTWLAIPAAAAAIVAIALVPTLRDADDPVAGGPAVRSSTTPEEQHPEASYVVLGAAGWEMTTVGESDGLLSVQFAKGEQALELNEYPADQFQQRLDDRLGVSTPRPGTLLGLPSTTVTYSARDHATIRPVEGESFVEVRADGMDLAAYERLLDELEATDAAVFARTVPPGTVTPETRDMEVARLMEGVAAPDGFTGEDFALTGFQDRYNATTTVAGAVGCAWLEIYDAGDAVVRQRALAALDSSREWPLLVAQVDRGDYPEVFWELADDLRAGRSGADLRSGIC